MTLRPWYNKDANYQTNAKSFMDYLARTNKFIEVLIEDYDNFQELVIAELERMKFDSEMAVDDILVNWLEDGTLARIINNGVLGNKADKEWVDTKFAEQEIVNTDLTENKANLDWVQDQLNGVQDELNKKLTKAFQDELFINALNPPEGYEPAIGDGVADDTEALQTLIDNFGVVVLPADHTYRITNTIYLRDRRKQLIGSQVVSSSSTDGRGVAEILYDGAVNRHKAVIVLGGNDVDEEPVQDSSGLVLQNVYVNGNYKAGFGVYGTYVTNETLIDTVTIVHTLEYGLYIARSWYSTFTRIVARRNKGKGLAFGMPLDYQNGQQIRWYTNAPLEINNSKIDDIRSHRSGLHYADDYPNTFNPTSTTHRRHGYGIGAGIGNSFHMENFTSESSGGVNLYVYTDSQPQKTLQKGYLEKPCVNSSLNPASDMANVIIEHLSDTGNSYEIKDIFMNYHSGGIFHTGKNRIVWLKNIHQPRFLKSLDGLSDRELFNIVLKENVYYLCGQYNTESPYNYVEAQERIDTNDEWRINIKYDGYKLISFRDTGDGTVPNGGTISVHMLDGTISSFSYPSNLSTTEWTPWRILSPNVASLRRAGTIGTGKRQIDIQVKNLAYTHF